MIVSDLPEWRRMFVEAGVATSCNPGSATSIYDAVNHWLARPEWYRNAREKGLQLATESWNYEVQFEPVMAALRSNTKYGETKNSPI